MGDWFDDSGQGGQVDVGELLNGQNGDGVSQLVNLGALVSMGLTSDGGALGVTVTVDGRWRREYFRDYEALTSWLAEALPAVQTAKAAAPPSGVNGSRQRRSRGL